MSRYLIVANLTAESPSLREQVQNMASKDPDAKFVILVPASLPAVPALLWPLFGINDKPLRLGRRRAQRARKRLEAIGVEVTSVRLSPHEPLVAIEAELQGERFDGVVISTLARPVSRWLSRDVPSRVRRRHPGLPVISITAPHYFYEDEPVRGEHSRGAITSRSTASE
ncbi:MAG: hypothetical protein ACYDA0_11565 [Candidatus Dormibacteraceae bacterium]